MCRPGWGRASRDAAGSAGTGGTGSGECTPSPNGGFTFDTNLQNWRVQYTSSGPIGAGGMTGLTAPVIAPNDVTLTCVASGGDPSSTPEAAQAQIQFSIASQYVGI